MKVLTLHRPWPWAIFHGPEPRKHIENRTWEPPKWLIGQYIGIHAGKGWSEDGEFFLTGGKLDMEHRLPLLASAIGLIGVARVVGFHRNVRTVPLEQRKWFFGPVGWELDSVQALSLRLPMNGAQGLWNLHPATEATVREDLRL